MYYKIFLMFHKTVLKYLIYCFLSPVVSFFIKQFIFYKTVSVFKIFNYCFLRLVVSFFIKQSVLYEFHFYCFLTPVDTTYVVLLISENKLETKDSSQNKAVQMSSRIEFLPKYINKINA